MRGRGTVAGIAGAMVALGWSAAVSAGAAAAGPASAGPVPSGPGAIPATTVNGSAAGGVQASLTVPRELPLDAPGRALPRQPITVTLTGVAGSAVTGDLQVGISVVGSASAAVPEFPQTLQEYSDTAAAWQDVPVPAASGPTWSKTFSGVSVPAGGTLAERFQMSAGALPISGLKVTASLAGSTVTTTIPVTAMALSVPPLQGTLQSGTAQYFTAVLSNQTAEGWGGVGFVFTANACGTGGCLHASDVLLELESGSTWAPVALHDTSTGVAGTVMGSGSVAATSGKLEVPLRVTFDAASAGVGPIQVALQGDGLPIGAPAAPMTVAVTPGAPVSSGVRTDASASDTPSDAGTPSASDSSSEAVAALTDSASASGDVSVAPAGVASSGGSGVGGTSTVILAAAGALVLSVLLLAWYFVWRKHDAARLAAAAGPVGREVDDEERAGHPGY
jgi:hypothetical protein